MKRINTLSELEDIYGEPLERSSVADVLEIPVFHEVKSRLAARAGQGVFVLIKDMLRLL